jgi:methyl-galactoside transport system substrate-binding protein
MKLLKKIFLSLGAIVIMITLIFLNSNQGVYAQTTNENQIPIKVGVLLYRFDDVYISLVRQSLEEIQKKNEGKVEFTFYDGKNNQETQNKTIRALLQSKSVNLLLLNLVDVKSADEVINKIKEYNIPVVLFNREPINMDAVKSYSKAVFVGTNAVEAGLLQGRLIIDAWNKNKSNIDRNGDNILQYIMLVGERDNKEAIQRTRYSVSTINDAGIQTEELSSIVCNWNRETAKEKIEPLFLYYGNNIEAIVSNNDEMAIGAIEVLQSMGIIMGMVQKQ